MEKKGAVNYHFIIKIVGAVIGAIGFFVMAFDQTRLGSIFIGIGTIIIALGE
ncbi:MAG TPA: hypothetical protein VJI32_07230 [Candidatus Nanoarchaeia archaeon]|nr:hypothetical protein [Candidatus Nanoarchaeia archaeon]